MITLCGMLGAELPPVRLAFFLHFLDWLAALQITKSKKYVKVKEVKWSQHSTRAAPSLSQRAQPSMKPTRVPQEVEKAAAPSCHPEEAQKNFVWNKILLKWLNPLIQLAYQGPLEESDVWPVADTDMSVQHHAAVFSAAWAAECAVAREKGGAAPSLRNTLLHIYRRDVIVGGLYQFQFMLLQLLQPFIIGRLLGYISSDREDNGGGGVGTGLMWALLLAVVAFLSSNALVLAFSNNRRFGTFVRAALMMSIYEHSMKITNASRMKNDIGTTTNLMAIDSEKVFFSVQFLHFLWYVYRI